MPDEVPAFVFKGHSITPSNILQQKSAALQVLKYPLRVIFLGDLLQFLHISSAIRRDRILVARRVVHEDVRHVETALLAFLLPRFRDGNWYCAYRVVVCCVRPID